jgi:hypothetical protein
MMRLASGIAGAFLVCLPAWWFFSNMVVVPQFRSGRLLDDYGTPIAAVVTIYGGAAIALLSLWRRAARHSRPVGGRRASQVSFWGSIAGVAVGAIGWVLFRWAETGRLMDPRASYGIVPVIFIVAAVFSAVLAAGAGLLWHARRPRTE